MERPNVTTAPRTATFQMRINPEVKREAERIFASCGMTLTDAINVFLQQSMNVGGLPFPVREPEAPMTREQALARLQEEWQKGIDSVKSPSDWITEEEVRAHFHLDR